MQRPEIHVRIDEVAPDFLTHLERTFGWSQEQAIDALGAYITSTKAVPRAVPKLDVLDCNSSGNAA